MENEVINISLSELSEKEGLSVRTQNVCEYSNLNDISSILNYYLEYGDFLRLRNCGSKSNVELIDICTKYENFKIKLEEETIPQIKNEEINIDLKELSEIEGLSVRTQNVCEYSNLKDIYSIFDYYLENGDFLKLRNCGPKSNLELIDICNRCGRNVKKQKLVISQENPNIPNLKKLDSLSTNQKAILNNLINSQFNELSIRSQTALKLFLGNDITLKNFDHYIFSDPEFKIANLRNVGESTKPEIHSFIISVKDQIEFVSCLTDDYNIEIKLFNTFLKRYFTIDDNLSNKIIKDYNVSNGLPIFKIIQGLIDNDILLDRHEKIIFQNEFCTTQTKEARTLNELSVDLKFTAERVRQIKRQLIRRFDKIFKFSFHAEIKSLLNYGMDLTMNYIDINDDLVCQINISEGTKFNQLFITRIFAIIYAEKYDLIGKIEQKNIQGDSDAVNWKKCYIVDCQITSIMDFNMLINDVHNRLSNKIEEDYTLYFQSYLLTFIKTSDYGNLDLIVEIAEYILFNEFEISINADDCIVFSRNTKIQVIDYVLKTLEESKKPLTVYELFDKIEQIYPGNAKGPESIRASCNRDSKLIFFGRSSTYGLKIWENDFSIKGGTIRDIAEEYLQNQTEPKHIDEITEYVNKYRNTNSNSIRANLHMDERKRFVFFSGMLIGITNKEYSTEKYAQAKEIQIERKTWEETFVCLQHFVEENNRIPCSTGSEFEIKLYRFMNFQLNKANASAIDNTEISKIFELVSKYNYKKKKRHTSTNLKESYAELRDFVLKNERLPRANYKDEKILYRFFYQQRKLFLEQGLSIEFKEKFIDIANSLNQTI